MYAYYRHGGRSRRKQKNHGLTITPEEAVNIANEFLFNAGLSDDIEIDNIYLINDSLSSEDRQELEELLSDESLPDDERQSITASLSDDNEDYAYYLCLVRQVNNTPCAYVDGASYGDTSDQYAPYWEYEYINMLVDADGIFEFSWIAPVAVTEIVTENAALKTFDEAMENIQGRGILYLCGSARGLRYQQGFPYRPYHIVPAANKRAKFFGIWAAGSRMELLWDAAGYLYGRQRRGNKRDQAFL